MATNIFKQLKQQEKEKKEQIAVKEQNLFISLAKELSPLSDKEIISGLEKHKSVKNIERLLNFPPEKIREVFSEVIKNPKTNYGSLISRLEQEVIEKEVEVAFEEDSASDAESISDDEGDFKTANDEEEKGSDAESEEEGEGGEGEIGVPPVLELTSGVELYKKAEEAFEKRQEKLGKTNIVLPPGKPKLTVCGDEYKTAKWIKGVVSIWITNPNGTNLDELEGLFVRDLTLNVNGKTWYSPTTAFYNLQCGYYRSEKIQKGTTLTLFRDEDEKQVNVMVGFRLRNNNFIVQDENVFNEEKNYFDYKYLSMEGRISKLLGRPVGLEPKARIVGLGEITKNLSNREYAEEVESIIYEETKNSDISHYFGKLADTVAYIEPWNGVETVIHHQAENGEIEPKMLVSLPPRDKLPEVFQNKELTEEQKEFYEAEIAKKEKNIVTRCAYRLFAIIEETAKVVVPILDEKVISLPEMPLYSKQESVEAPQEEEEEEPTEAEPQNLLLEAILKELDEMENNVVQKAETEPKDSEYHDLVCEYCKSVVEGDGYKSIALSPEKEPKIVTFCKLDCMEKAKFKK